jgi:hypothetical protein
MAVRELLVLVVVDVDLDLSCDNAIEAEISSTLIASVVEVTILNLVDTITLTLLDFEISMARFEGEPQNRLTSDDPSPCCVA